MSRRKPDQSDYPLIEREPGSVLIRDGARAMSVEHLSADGWRLSQGLDGYRHVVNICRRRSSFLTGFLGALIARATTLLPGSAQPAAIEEIRKLYPDALVLTDAVIDQLLADRHIAESARPSESRQSMAVELDGDHIAAIAFTSGSTGDPKPIVKTVETLYRGARFNADQLLSGLAGPIDLVATVPPQHMYGLEMTVMLPLVAPLAVVDCQPLLPADVRDAFEGTGETAVLVSTPVHLSALVRSGIDFPSVSRVLSATSPMSADLAVNVERLTSGELLEVYGYSEAGCVACRATASQSHWQLYPQYEFIQSADGTWELHAPHIDAPVPTADLLKWHDDGGFTLEGRRSDFVNIAGKRGSLGAITLWIQGLPGVHDAVVFAPGDDETRLAALVAVDSDVTVEAIRGGILEKFDPVFVPRPIHLVERLPRTDSGKLPRAVVLEQFARLAQTG